MCAEASVNTSSYKFNIKVKGAKSNEEITFCDVVYRAYNNGCSFR